MKERDEDAEQVRVVRAVEVWDTVVSIHLIAQQDECDGALLAIVDWLEEVDEIFSTFREDSAISRWHRGTLAEGELPQPLVEALRLGASAEERSHGAFRLNYAGKPDPMGLVKGLAVDRAVAIAAAHGIRNAQVNAGGDLRVSGSPEPATGRPWRVGITDPRDASAVIDVVSGHDLAMATSGDQQRGEHIVVQGERLVASASVIGPTAALADAYATALFATNELVELQRGLDAEGWPSLVIGTDARIHASASWPGEISRLD